MKFALVVLGSPFSSQATQTAFRFCSAALAAEHQIYRVFFYQDGVYCASRCGEASNGSNYAELWQELQRKHSLDLAVCVGASTRRGLLDETQLDTQGLIADGFEVSGLGQLIDAILNADRLITFGA